MSGVPAFSPPPEVAQIADTLESRGFQAWAVGGAIRDELLGQPREDWDLATDAPPPDVRRIFRRTVPIGIEHGTVGVLSPTGAMFEVTTFRRDIETDGRHAVIEFATTIQEDLARRDFTINAMGWRPATDEFVDPWGGKADLEDGVLKAVGDPRQRVAEDYLRVLRGLRFAGRLDLEIESATREALEAGVRGSATLSAERVREELGKVLRGQQPSAALRLYGEFGVLEIWYAEIAASRQHPHWELNLAAVDAISARRPLLRLVRWLLAPGSVDEAADPALASEAEGEARASVGCRALGRLRFSNADTQYVAQLLRHYRPLVSPMDSSARIRGWLSEVGVEKARDLFRLHIADARAANAGETLRYLCHAWRRVHDEILAGHPLRISDLEIGGDELLALGVRRGPAVGLLLDELLARVLEDPELNRVGELRELARELIEISSLASGREEGGPESMGG